MGETRAEERKLGNDLVGKPKRKPVDDDDDDPRMVSSRVIHVCQ